MAFRTKAKKLFKSKTRSDSSSNESTISTSHDVYKPGEPMPPPKYRRPAAKEHTEKLEAFSFADAWRKRSFQSSHSPMGTAANSRRTSMLSVGRRSRKSVANVSEDGRSNSVISGTTENSLSQQKTIVPTAPAQKSVVKAGGDDVGDDGLSQFHSSKEKSAQPNGNAHVLHNTRSLAQDHQPFSEHDIANALQRSRLQVPAH